MRHPSKIPPISSMKHRVVYPICSEFIKYIKWHCWITAVLREVQDEGIPEEWRRSKITPIYKQKGDPLDCGNYRGIKLLSHCLKL